MAWCLIKQREAAGTSETLATLTMAEADVYLNYGNFSKFRKFIIVVTLVD
jgi:hypothetical protein